MGEPQDLSPEGAERCVGSDIGDPMLKRKIREHALQSELGRGIDDEISLRKYFGEHLGIRSKAWRRLRLAKTMLVYKHACPRVVCLNESG